MAPGSASAWRLSVPIPERCSQSDNYESARADPEKGVPCAESDLAEPDPQLLNQKDSHPVSR